MHQFFKSVFFNFEFVRILGSATFGGCEPGEVIELFDSIKDGDPESWHEAFKNAAQRSEVIAKEAETSGNHLAARGAFLRTANYFRAAQFMLNSRPGFEDPRSLSLSELSIQSFQKAVRLMEGEVLTFEIPYEDSITLPAYLYLPPAARRLPGGKTPVLICTGGMDSTLEELYFISGASGPELGYAVLAFEGPGQGITLRREKGQLHLRSDWDFVIGKVLDKLYLLAVEEKYTHFQLDLARVAICGSTLGGQLALRGATDPRIAACVAFDPLYSVWDVATAQMPPTLIWAWESGWISDATFSMILGIGTKFDFKVQWEMNHLQWALGTNTLAGVMRRLRDFSLECPGGNGQQGSYLDKVRCPVMVTGAEASLYSSPDASTNRIWDKLEHLGPDQKRIWIGKTVADGGLQAKVGAFALAQQKLYAFLDEQFGVDRSSL